MKPEMYEFAVLLCYGDGNVGFIVHGWTVASVTLAVASHMVDPTRDLLAMGVKLHVPK